MTVLESSREREKSCEDVFAAQRTSCEAPHRDHSIRNKLSEDSTILPAEPRHPLVSGMEIEARDDVNPDMSRAKEVAKGFKDIEIGDSTACVRLPCGISELEEQVKRAVQKVNSLSFDDAETTRFIVCDGHGDVRAEDSHFEAQLSHPRFAKPQKQETEKISVQLLRGMIEELEANRSSDVAILPRGNKEHIAAWEETEEKFVLSIDGFLEIAAAFYETSSAPDGRKILETGTVPEDLPATIRDANTTSITAESTMEELPLCSRISRTSGTMPHETEEETSCESVVKSQEVPMTVRMQEAEPFDRATTVQESGALARESAEAETENRDAVAEKFQKFLKRSQETCEIMKCRPRDILDGRCEEYSDWCSIGLIGGDGLPEGREVANEKACSADTMTTRCDPVTSNIQQDIGDGVNTDDAMVFQRSSEETNSIDAPETSAFSTADKRPKNCKRSFGRRMKQFFSKIIRKKNL